MRALPATLPAQGGRIYRYDVMGEQIVMLERLLEARQAEYQAAGGAAKGKGKGKAKGQGDGNAALAARIAGLEGTVATLKSQTPIVFLLEVPTLWQRSELDLLLDAEAPAPASRDFAAALAAAIQAAYPAGSEECGLAEDYVENLEKIDLEAALRLQRLADELRGRAPDLNMMLVAQRRRAELGKYLRVLMHLKGWEGLDLPFATDSFGATAETVSHIPDWFPAIATKIENLSTLSGEARKNLSPPSVIASSQASSRAS